MPRRSTTRLPLGPVLDVLGDVLGRDGRRVYPKGCRHTNLARQGGLARRTVMRWARAGVPYWSADELASRLGRHPWELWPDWYDLRPYDDAEVA